MTERIDLSTLLRDALPRHDAPADLREWAMRQARALDETSRARVEPDDVIASRATPGKSARRWWQAAALVAAMLVGWVGHGVMLRPHGEIARVALVDEIVDSHVRSLMLDHLVDVRSTDRHTVKPWFAGKVDVAPSVPELALAGFPLIGGRMDYVGGHAAPAIVYGRRQHVINLYLWRASAADENAASDPASRDGYHVLRWTAGGMVYWAVSDVEPADLVRFRDAYLAAR